MANKILFTSKKADGDNKVHVIAAKRFKLFNLMVYSSHVKANARIIYNIPYPNKLFAQSDVTITFLGVRKTFLENGYSLGNFSV